jgi:hypothetical protein
VTTGHATSFVLPVMGATPGPRGRAKVVEACGTAFPIGKDTCLTAAHVWERVQSFPFQTLAVMDNPQSGEAKLVQIGAGEAIAGVDIAIIRVPTVEFRTVPSWSVTPTALLDEVETFGYPYGFDPESETFNVRGFRGEIVGGRVLACLAARPAALELSFACPRGLSGAPLIRTAPASAVIGVIVGNAITEMIVYQEEEKLTEGGRESVFTKTEAMHLGIAVKVSEILPLQSRLLDGTIDAWVRRCGLLA